ncbi:BTAD domain-containing putative transcriptional regulator [Streptomyces sp. NPDC046853]|uniref:AfsR/SARP family transcriptional regulator n=1 Tax=Streptomyces sp. NPDC046853 TaxID=3154920 RepID=UPI0033BFE8CE
MRFCVHWPACCPQGVHARSMRPPCARRTRMVPLPNPEEWRVTSVRIQLLGCVEVRTGKGEAVDVPEGARRLLTCLAWNPNDMVTDDTMVDRIWDSCCPQHPRQTLYTHAARLRKALREVADTELPVEVHRRRGGYLLSCDETAIDLFRFRGTVQRARAHARAEEPQEALRLFEEALALWRGMPLSGLSSHWADSVRAALGHEYRAAIVRLIGLSLRHGGCDEYLPVLHRVSADHPLDERIAGLLMITLYRSGRQGEALDSFSAIRRQMIDELGDEPGQQLRSLHAQILKRDSSLHIDDFARVN